jgi:5-formyltetrahydrofolate cyclo-ligase
MPNDQSLITQEQSRQSIRKLMRERRNSLAKNEQNLAGIQLCEQIKQIIKPNNVVALYLDNDGEISTKAIINDLQEQKIKTLLPVMHSFNKGYLNFQTYLCSNNTDNTSMVKNHFNILEPKLNAQHTYALSQIDYIFMPLVAFDSKGNRLGMGGGFYDRTLSKINTLSNRPKLCGLAHSCQHVDALPYQAWDVPIDLIITPTKIIIPNT